MDIYHPKMRRAKKGESHVAWLARQRRLDVLQRTKPQPTVETYDSDILLDDIGEQYLLELETQETWRLNYLNKPKLRKPPALRDVAIT